MSVMLRAVRKAHITQLNKLLSSWRTSRPVNIINPQLCESALDKLDLTAYKSPILIDMNPGACIWSAALHNRLKPRSHILLEPETKYEPILKEFTAARPNAYWLPLNGYDWSTYLDLFSPSPPSPPWPSTPYPPFDVPYVPPEDGVNTDLIFAGNLSTANIKGERLLAQFISCVPLGRWIHKFGRVRFLIWTQDVQKERYFPRAIAARSRSTVVTETVCDIQEIASSPVVRTGKGRFRTAELVINEEGNAVAPPKLPKKPPGRPPKSPGGPQKSNPGAGRPRKLVMSYAEIEEALVRIEGTRGDAAAAKALEEELLEKERLSELKIKVDKLAAARGEATTAEATVTKGAIAEKTAAEEAAVAERAAAERAAIEKAAAEEAAVGERAATEKSAAEKAAAEEAGAAENETTQKRKRRRRSNAEIAAEKAAAEAAAEAAATGEAGAAENETTQKRKRGRRSNAEIAAEKAAAEAAATGEAGAAENETTKKRKRGRRSNAEIAAEKAAAAETAAAEKAAAEEAATTKRAAEKAAAEKAAAEKVAAEKAAAEKVAAEKAAAEKAAAEKAAAEKVAAEKAAAEKAAVEKAAAAAEAAGSACKIGRPPRFGPELPKKPNGRPRKRFPMHMLLTPELKRIRGNLLQMIRQDRELLEDEELLGLMGSIKDKDRSLVRKKGKMVRNLKAYLEKGDERWVAGMEHPPWWYRKHPEALPALAEKMVRERSRASLDFTEHIQSAASDALKELEGLEGLAGLEKGEEKGGKQSNEKFEAFEARWGRKGDVLGIQQGRIDEQIAYNKQLLQWQKRKFEPLAVENEDFHPADPLALLDFTPKLIDEFFRPPTAAERENNWEIYNWMLRNLFGLRAHSISAALSTLVPGGENILAMYDEEAGGGKIDPLQRTRTLTTKQLIELTKAWNRWPFKVASAHMDHIVDPHPEDKHTKRFG